MAYPSHFKTSYCGCNQKFVVRGHSTILFLAAIDGEFHVGLIPCRSIEVVSEVKSEDRPCIGYSYSLALWSKLLWHQAWLDSSEEYGIKETFEHQLFLLLRPKRLPGPQDPLESCR